MSASIVSLHWACNLIGLNGYWEPVAWAVPLAMELGMAAVASTATTIRKEARAGEEVGGYYVSLWIIFSFVMLLAQAANIGHAVEQVATNQDLPPVIPVGAVYFFACAFAALFPLGGTLFVHVSGFLRAHGTGARWIDGDAEIVHEQVAPGALVTKPARAQAPRAPRAQDQTPAARTEPAVSAPTPAAPRAAATPDEQKAARLLFDQQVLADPLTKPDARAIQREAGLDGVKNPATVRRWVQAWWEEHQASLGQGSPDPIETEAATAEAGVRRLAG
jgi:hypothetical protein